MNNIYCLEKEMIDLAHQALRCNHWTIHPPEASRQYPKRNQRGMLWVRERQPWGDRLPDFGDDATRGCLLALVAKAYGVTLDDVHVVRTTGKVWSVWIFRANDSSYRVATHESSRAEALVAALEAAEHAESKKK